MARAETVTKLPLDRWAQMFGINPIHFNQCNIPNLELNTICESGWFQHDWQDGERVSREQLAGAIYQAEQMIESELGYRLIPTWEADEYHSFESHPLRPEFYNIGAVDVKGRRTGIRLDWGYFIAGGQPVKVLIDDNAAIAWSDSDGDSYNDLATVSVTVDADQDACELEVYYPGKNGADRWQIRPISVSVSGTAATITFKRELCVLESAMAGYDVRGVSYVDNANFLTVVDVYRRYNDPQSQATVLWESTGCEECSGSGCPSCGFNVQTACLRVRGDDRISFTQVQPADWDADTESFTSAAFTVSREADAVRTWYRAGWRDKDAACPMRDMDTDLAWCVAVLSASLLDRKVCDCKGIADGVKRWQIDAGVAKSAEQLSIYKLPESTLRNCPFGTRMGAIEAWLRLSRPGVQKARIGRAILA